MGLFFEERDPDPQLVQLLRHAIETEPPTDVRQEAANLAAGFEPFVSPLRTALALPRPLDFNDAGALASANAAAISEKLRPGTNFATGRFVVALIIFFALLGGAIGTDVANLKDSSTALYGLATTVFGVVVGVLGAEKP